MRGWIVGLVGAVLTVFVIAALAVAAVLSSDSETALVDLEPGDCFTLPDSADTGSIETVVTIDCSEPHEAEVVGVGALGSENREYPSDDVLFAEVEERCREIELADADAFGLLPVAPTERLWASFDGRYLCIAIPFGGGTTEGSALMDGS